jgi:hypothetical protein
MYSVGIIKHRRGVEGVSMSQKLGRDLTKMMKILRSDRYRDKTVKQMEPAPGIITLTVCKKTPLIKWPQCNVYMHIHHRID